MRKGEGGEKEEGGEKGEGGEKEEGGEKGERGEKGEGGEKGERGEKGEGGEKGERGEKGDGREKGEGGEKEERGEKGDGREKGEGGENGERGEKGEGGGEREERKGKRRWEVAYTFGNGKMQCLDPTVVTACKNAWITILVLLSNHDAIPPPPYIYSHPKQTFSKQRTHVPDASWQECAICGLERRMHISMLQ